ncbi:methylenetetrahydrofolate reductase [Lichtheimia corymbifera JMRC:FSU:9682]|uniref:Methylenetetrahydrofolate reductase n=1 Tax=Lichtheimia corymbifera JMRC:FSU:9682 TaxID=1263082 RepID=A0A068RES7_9FUNG|nr:methylenetetrahydrofolate reductase [Lichtheimia corymbifera JMRC:FSU:9682]
MKITDKLEQAKQKGHISYSFEFFPPKTDAGLANLFDRMGRMATLEPYFVACTWGAGGSTQQRTLEVCSTAQSVYGLETLMHLTCTNMEKEKIDRALEDAKAAGIQNILALRGDPPRGQEYWTPCDDQFQHAADLVKYIRQHYGDYFCIGVAGYPEGHMDTPDKAQDLQYLKDKVDCGADFILSQLFYDVDVFKTWVKKCRDLGITVPIIPSILPIPTHQSFRRIINLCRIQVPKAILDKLEQIKSDDQKVKDYGVELAVDMISDLRASGLIDGIHLSTLNLERSSRLILERLKLAPSKKEQPKNRVLAALASDASLVENWDEFPNGRYGDARSPAFGENTYIATQLAPTSEAAKKWGHPTTVQDITRLFERYITGDLSSLPWCDEPLQTESDTIQQHLTQFNRQGYWTVGSQPAVNGARSEDPVYGWGPKGGYVYQKAFIECFVSDEQLHKLLERLKKDPHVTYYATNRKGDLSTNVENTEDQNAVTWGVFPGKEIVQPTIIERVSFEAWRDEAYQLWKEWEQQYPADSKTAQLLRDIAERYWLINVVHNDFQQPSSLFEAMLP